MQSDMDTDFEHFAWHLLLSTVSETDSSLLGDRAARSYGEEMYSLMHKEPVCIEKPWLMSIFTAFAHLLQLAPLLIVKPPSHWES